MWNWLMVRPERMIVTVGAVVVTLLCVLVWQEREQEARVRARAFAGDGWIPYTAEVHEAFQANCERLQQPGRLC